jgi:lipopolysaccharide export system permease protein
MTRTTPGTLVLPTLGRYVVTEFLRVFALCLGAFLILYLIVDFFDHFDDFLKFKASIGAAIRYFLFKIPLIVTQVTPVAVLASLLLALGGLSRHNEITAMQACGVSLVQLTGPLLATCLLLSLFSLVWNESVVPYFNRKVRTINTVEIKKRELPTIFGTSELWSHGENSVLNVKMFDAQEQRLMGVTLYRIGGDFRLEGVTEVPWAKWTGERWKFRDGVEREFLPSGEVRSKTIQRGTLALRETPETLSTARREAEEYDFFALRSLIENMQRKGLDPTEYVVDLHLKLAVPFISLVMALIAIPFGMRNLRATSLATNIGTALVIGFSYWVVLALAISLGHSGALPPIVAAWTANVIFCAAGVFLLLGTP